MSTVLNRAMEDAAMALDRASVRTFDHDGRLHVAVTNISKATVNEYIGREIPDYQALGLDPDKRYKLFRDPEELAKGAATFNNIPLLSRHVAVTVDDHQPDLVVGSTGTDAEFVAPYLRNSLVIWARDAIEAVESEVQKELSSAYRYRADMTPGTFEGQPYDGVMRDIIANHVSLVKEGRAGADVVVGDSKEDLLMTAKRIVLTRKGAVTLGALAGYLKPKLAQDAKLDMALLVPGLDGLTAKNFKDKRPTIIAGLKVLTKDKLAKDASIDDVVELLDTLETIEPAEVVEAAIADPKGLGREADPAAAKDADDAEVRAFLKGKLSDEDIEKVCAMMGTGAAMDETAEEKAKRELAEKTAKDAENEKLKSMVTKPAMDAAITAAVKIATDTANKTQREIRDAEKAVRPFVGDLAMAHDSADAVYRTALTTLGVKIDGIHPSAYPAILGMQPVPGSKKTPVVAMDAAGAKSFADRYPDAVKIGIL